MTDYALSRPATITLRWGISWEGMDFHGAYGHSNQDTKPGEKVTKLAGGADRACLFAPESYAIRNCRKTARLPRSCGNAQMRLAEKVGGPWGGVVIV